MSISYYNLLKRYVQSYTVEWTRWKEDPDYIELVGFWEYRDLDAAANRRKVLQQLYGITWY